jgi:cobalt-zinc-cadmium efflux system outer membrane protein
MYCNLQQNRRSATLALLLGVLASSPAYAAPLTEAETLRLGLSRPELSDLARARLGEAEAEVLKTTTWTNPTFELLQDKTGASRETIWQLAQPVDFSGRRELHQEAARHRRTGAEAENRAVIGERATELRRAFHELLRQQETLRRLQREQRTSEARLAETRANFERIRASLSALLGQSADDGASGRLLPDPPVDVVLLQAKLAARPELASLTAKADAANADNAATRRNFPEVTFGIGGKQVDDGPTRERGLLFSVSIPLPIFDRQQAADRRTASQAMTARAELALARQQAEGELVGRHRQLTQLIAAAERYRRDAVAPSADLVRIAETAYRTGESTVLELLDAYKGALEAETMALDLEWKAREASIELDQLTGNYPQ